MKRKTGLLLLLMISILCMGCNNKNQQKSEEDKAQVTPVIADNPVEDNSDEDKNSTPSENEDATNNEVPSENNDAEPSSAQEEAANDNIPKEPVIIDGFDITAAVSGTPLKEAYKDYFKIGAGLYGYDTSVDTINSKPLTEIIKYHFNSVTYTNLMKPQHLLDQKKSISNYAEGKDEPGVKFDTVLKGLNFCKENGIQMRGHVLVWHAQTPDWFFREGFQSSGAYVSREIMLSRLESYIKQVLEFTQTEYPGVVYAWDVVNEAVEISPGMYEKETGYNIRTKHGENQDNLWYTIVGTDYVEKSFEYARKYADPDVKLFYNDFNTFQPSKTVAIVKLVNDLKSKNLIDGIGMQGYMSLGYPGIFGGQDNVMKALTSFSQTGLEIHITELSISMDSVTPENLQKQAEKYQSLFELLVGVDDGAGRNTKITSVTFFGVQDGYHLYPNDTTNTRLFDSKMQPKPAFHSVLGVVENRNKK